MTNTKLFIAAILIVLNLNNPGFTCIKNEEPQESVKFIKSSDHFDTKTGEAVTSYLIEIPEKGMKWDLEGAGFEYKKVQNGKSVTPKLGSTFFKYALKFQVPPEEDDQEECDITGTPKPTPVKSVDEAPYSAYGKIFSIFFFEDKDEQSGTRRYVMTQGTGVMISPLHIVTAGHNAYAGEKIKRDNPGLEDYASGIIFIPRLNGKKDENVATIEDFAIVTEYKVLENWVEKRDSNYDLALLSIKPGDLKKVIAPLPYYPVVDLNQIRQQKSKVLVCGYNGTPKTRLIMHEIKGEIDSPSTGTGANLEYKMRYSFTTKTGYSGAGIIIEDEDNHFKCIGVHTTGGSNNGGIYFNDSMIQILKDWIEPGIQEEIIHLNNWYYQAAKQQGDASSQVILGWMYENGIGVDKDSGKAIKWYGKAADQGHSNALINLGWMYANGIGVDKDPQEAAEFYKKAARKKDPMGQYNLGWMYANGIGVDKDLQEAERLFVEAATHGSGIIQYNVGMMYAKGLRVEKNLQEGVKWYHEAAKKNEAEAQFTLGWRYERGIGVELDPKKSEEFYRAAANQGHANALVNLGSIYENKLSSNQEEQEQNEKVAFQCYEKAAIQRHAYGQYNLAWMYENGIGTEKNDEKAQEWYSKAAALGRNHAEEFIDLRFSSKNKNDLASSYHLGWMYENGRGVKQKDMERAKTYYKNAADKGHVRAISALKRLQTQ